MAQRLTTPEPGVGGNDSLRTFHILYRQKNLLIRTTHYANAILKNMADAEDAALEGYFHVSQRVNANPELVTNWEHLGAYCYRAVRNICIDLCRYRDSRNTLSFDGPVMTEEGARPLTSWLRDDSRHFDGVEAAIVLEEALRRLPQQCQEPVVLRELHRLTHKEAAEVLGITVPAFKSRFYRGRSQLRQLLAEEGAGEW